MARSYRIDEALLALNTPGADDTVEMMLSTLLDGVKNDLRQGIAAGMVELRDDATAERKVTLGRIPLRLTPERAAQLHSRISDLITEFCSSDQQLGAPLPGTQLYHLFVAYFPSYIADEPADQV